MIRPLEHEVWACGGCWVFFSARYWLAGACWDTHMVLSIDSMFMFWSFQSEINTDMFTSLWTSANFSSGISKWACILQNHRMIYVERTSGKHFVWTSVQAPWASCPEPSPTDFWIPPSMESPPHFWISCSSSQQLSQNKSVSLHLDRASYVCLCPLPLVLSLYTIGKSLTLYPHFRRLYALMRSPPKPFLSATLSALPHIRGVTIP